MALTCSNSVGRAFLAAGPIENCHCDLRTLREMCWPLIACCESKLEHHRKCLNGKSLYFKPSSCSLPYRLEGKQAPASLSLPLSLSLSLSLSLFLSRSVRPPTWQIKLRDDSSQGARSGQDHSLGAHPHQVALISQSKAPLLREIQHVQAGRVVIHLHQKLTCPQAVAQQNLGQD